MRSVNTTKIDEFGSGVGRHCRTKSHEFAGPGYGRIFKSDAALICGLLAHARWSTNGHGFLQLQTDAHTPSPP